MKATTDQASLAEKTRLTDLPPVELAPAAWEEIAAGRFMPRRIRGSHLGRELG